MLGMAYELGAIYDKPVKEIDLSHGEAGDDINNSFKVDVRTENCSLFLARKVENVKISESPAFIKNRLMACGIRPINNVVDISNYVMLELGQPLHFYDANKLGDTIVVRMAENGEKLKTLDDVAKKDIKKTSSIKKPFNKNNSAPIQKKPAREANFTQRDYDYDSLEKQLLGWDIE